MESITIKVEGSLAKEIDDAMKPDYSTKTEFIREAIREKIKEIRKEKAVLALSKEELIREFMKFRGKAKRRLSDKEFERIREQASKELMEDLEKRFR